MSNFEKQFNAVVHAYSELSGIDRLEIIEECKNSESVTYRIITKMMFTAR